MGRKALGSSNLPLSVPPIGKVRFGGFSTRELRGFLNADLEGDYIGCTIVDETGAAGNKSMPNGAPLREWKERGRKVVIMGWVALFFETILILALGSLYGIVGLGAAVILFNVTLLIVVLSLQDQINAIDGALRGARDESSYSAEIESHLRRRHEQK